MLKKIFPVLAVLAIFITACGPQGTPTLAPAEVEGTAVAAAWTMVAMTQQAIPTNTPVPPTETPSPTPLPTFTPVPLPTNNTPLVIPTATLASGQDNCLKPLNVAEAGPQSNVRIENDSGGNVTLSLNLATNLFGQCGNLSYTLAKKEKLVISLPKGEYFAYAWITYSDGDTSNASGYIVNRVGDNHQFNVIIRKEVIVVP
ncbi:MAG: hypothetical protein IH589_05855 [Anaerolineales bacterium]|nr:hypothetical protein [Anaerolineales bacterium]